MNKYWKIITGHRFNNQYKWGEFCWRLHPKHWNLSLQFTESYGESTDLLVVTPLLFSAYIYFPTTICQPDESWQRGNGKSYGFYLYPSVKNFECLVLCFGKWSKHIEMPWTYKWLSSEVLDFNYNPVYYEDRHTNNRENRTHRWEKEEAAKRLTEKTYDYTYTRKSGEVQKRKATVCVERLVWTMRWLPLRKMIRTSIWVTFNEEIGERIGSWKGGTTGCGWTVRDGETPEMALRRMEKERKFK